MSLFIANASPSADCRQIRPLVVGTAREVGIARVRFDFMSNGFQRNAKRVTASIGFAVVAAGDTAASLLTRADKARYHVKRRGHKPPSATTLLLQCQLRAS